MVAYLTTALALFLAALMATWARLYPLGIVVFPVPVALYLARGRRGLAAGLIACVGVGALAASGAWEVGLLYLLAAGAGWPLGLGLTRRWAYGRMVSILTVWAFALVLMSIVGAWDDWNAQAVFAHDTLTAELDKRTEANPADEQAAAIRANLTWLKDRWASLGLGLTFCPVLIGACVAVSFMARWARLRCGRPGPRGSFRDMRVPEWLVWVVILAAVTWFIDRRWPVTGLRIVSWNTAVGLSAVYWLNGLSILVYAATVLRPHLFVTVAAVFVLFYLGVHPVLCFVGLFDTWSDFRRRIDRFILERSRRIPPEDDAP